MNQHRRLRKPLIALGALAMFAAACGDAEDTVSDREVVSVAIETTVPDAASAARDDASAGTSASADAGSAISEDPELSTVESPTTVQPPSTTSTPPAATTTEASASDLVVDTPTVSDSSPTAGERFTLSATVRNQGNGPSASTTLRYYRSADANITAGDTPAGTNIVSRLDARQSGAESVGLTAPSTPGTYYYGACADSVARESDTQNNCSTAVTVTVAGTGECYVGRVVAEGERCTYPGSTEDFWVDSSGRGHFTFAHAGTGIDVRGATINGVRYNFAASKQSDGTWIIEAAG